jgi:hypothetical protein
MYSHDGKYIPIHILSTFVVPSDDHTWPKELWKFKLGIKTWQVRSQGLYDVQKNEKRRAQLEELGLVIEALNQEKGISERRFQTFYAALEHFAKLNNVGMYSHDGKYIPIHILSTFVVPSDDHTWPKELWKFKLGIKTWHVRSQGLYDVQKNEKRRAQLEELGLVIEALNQEKGKEC